MQDKHKQQISWINDPGHGLNREINSSPYIIIITMNDEYYNAIPLQKYISHFYFHSLR